MFTIIEIPPKEKKKPGPPWDWTSLFFRKNTIIMWRGRYWRADKYIMSTWEYTEQNEKGEWT